MGGRAPLLSTGAPGSGTEMEALLLLTVVGIDPGRDFTKWERLGASESAQALADGTISAYFAGYPLSFGSPPSGGRRAGGAAMALLSAVLLVQLLGALGGAGLAAPPYLYMVLEYESLIYRAIVPPPGI